MILEFWKEFYQKLSTIARTLNLLRSSRFRDPLFRCIWWRGKGHLTVFTLEKPLTRHADGRTFLSSYTGTSRSGVGIGVRVFVSASLGIGLTKRPNNLHKNEERGIRLYFTRFLGKHIPTSCIQITFIFRAVCGITHNIDKCTYQTGNLK